MDQKLRKAGIRTKGGEYHHARKFFMGTALR
jgi:hypothetical protein